MGPTEVSPRHVYPAVEVLEQDETWARRGQTTWGSANAIETGPTIVLPTQQRHEARPDVVEECVGSPQREPDEDGLAVICLAEPKKIVWYAGSRLRPASRPTAEKEMIGYRESGTKAVTDVERR